MEKRWYRQANNVTGSTFHTIYLPLWKNVDASLNDLVNTSGNIQLRLGTTYVFGVMQDENTIVDIEKTLVKDY